MIRVRFYKFTLSLPITLVVGSIAYTSLGFGPTEIGFNFGTITFAFGFLLQLLFFSDLRMSAMWEVTLCDWAFDRTFCVCGETDP